MENKEQPTTAGPQMQPQMGDALNVQPEGAAVQNAAAQNTAGQNAAVQNTAGQNTAAQNAAGQSVEALTPMPQPWSQLQPQTQAHTQMQAQPQTSAYKSVSVGEPVASELPQAGDSKPQTGLAQPDAAAPRMMQQQLNTTQPAVAEQAPMPQQYNGVPQSQPAPQPAPQSAPQLPPRYQAVQEGVSYAAPQSAMPQATVPQPLMPHTPPTPGFSAPQQMPQQDNAMHQPQLRKTSSVGVIAAASVIAIVLGLTCGMVGGSLVKTERPVADPITINNPENTSAVTGIAAARTKSVVTIEVLSPNGKDSGSGVVYTDKGHIITNAHVVGAAAAGGAMRVRLSNGELLPAKLVGTDPYADLAVVKVERSGLVPIPLADSDSINVGDLTVAIGSPLNLPSTITSGVVSALNRGIAVRKAQGGENSSEGWQLEDPRQRLQDTREKVTLPVVQTDASINPGNSGGALLNSKGELIGINVAIASTPGNSQTAGSVGLGFAIPSNLVKRVVTSLIAGEKPSHGLLGATVSDASNLRDASHSGGLIEKVMPNSPAAAAGLQPGDIVTKVNGFPAADGTSVSALVRMHPGGSKVTLEIIRDGQERKIDAVLGELGELE